MVLAVYEVLVYDDALADVGVRAALVAALQLLTTAYIFQLPAENARLVRV